MMLRLSLALAAVSGALLLAACVSDEQAVDMGLATACDGSTTYAKLGDPAGRYLVGTRSEVCRGPKRDAGNRSQIVVVDCSAASSITATASQQMADPRRHGPDFNRTAAADAQVMRLKVGITDFAGLQQGLQAADVPFAASGATGVEQCRAMAGRA